jgi:CubicO group peptidase (beta-lactamase class C family)
MIRFLFTPVILILMPALSVAASMTPQAQPASGFIPLDPVHCLQAAAYSRAHGGEALRIEQGGRLVYEDYLPGFSATTPHKIYSGTKSFMAVTAMILVSKGLLRLDEKASDTLTEWQHDARRSITIDELLSQTSGLDPNGERIYASYDQLAAAVTTPLVDPPGTRFHYGPAGYQAFGEILRRKICRHGQSVEDLVNDTLLDPYDLDVSDWVRDRAGNVLIHAGMLLSPKAWAKFGNLLLKPVLATGANRDALGYAAMFQGHKANPAYGLGFWLNNPQRPHHHQSIRDLLPAMDGDQLYPGGLPDLVCAMGTGKERLYVIPSRQIVIVRFSYEAPFSDGDFLSRLLTGKPHPDAHTH